MPRYPELLLGVMLPGMSLAAAEDDSAVLTAVATDFCGPSWTRYAVLASETDDVIPEKILEQHGLSAELVVSLTERSRTTSAVPSLVDYKCLRLRDSKRIHALFSNPKRNSWAVFYKAFRGSEGLVSVALPGYSSSNREAAVIVNYRCDLLCGSTVLYVLERTDTSWKILKRDTLLVS